MAETLLSASNVEVAYGAARKVKVLHGVDLSIARGETLGIVGESGRARPRSDARCCVSSTSLPAQSPSTAQI